MGLHHRSGWWRSISWGLIAACLLFMASPAMAVDEAMIKRMEELIQKQQAQIEAQARAIEKMQKQIGEISSKAVEEATAAAKSEMAKAGGAPPDVVRNTNGDKVALKIYGQVNRAFLFADDGDSSDYYFVDNDNSSSRMGFLGEAKVNEDITIGTRMNSNTSPIPATK